MTKLFWLVIVPIAAWALLGVCVGFGAEHGLEIVNVFHADKKYCAVLTGGNRHPDIEDRFF